MKLHAHHRILAIAALTAVVALGATACGSGSSSSTSTPAAGGGSSSGGDSGGGTPVDVTLKEYSITVSGGTTLAAGTYTFHVSNSGTMGHNLTIDGPGVEDATTGTFSAGGTADLTVTLKDGTYEFYCSVPGHKELGMDDTVTAGMGGSGGGGSSGGGSSGGGSSQSGGGWS
jgi:plastocyanin